MEKLAIPIRTETITMDKLLKFSGVADTGGQAFRLIEEGEVFLNGSKVSEKRRQVRPGDTVSIGGRIALKVVREEP